MQVEEIRKIVDTELGFVTDSPFRRQEAKTFLFVSVNKRVVGCAVAVHIDKVSLNCNNGQVMDINVI